MKKDLKILYREKIVPSLKKEFGYTNIEAVPKLVKITINRGVGEASKNAKDLDTSAQELSLITGQKPRVNTAKKSVASFKIRDGMSIGLSTTMRREKMYNFLSKLIHMDLPRIRDFRGISPNCFDGRGNYNFGIKEHLVFPEIDFNTIEKMFGLNVTVTTTAKSDEEALMLLKLYGFPLR